VFVGHAPDLEPWGQRFVGKAAVREGLASRLQGLPDVHYSDDRRWVSHLGVPEWLPTGTTPDGRLVRFGGLTIGSSSTKGDQEGFVLEDRLNERI